VIEEAFPAGRSLEEVVDATLDGQREMVLLATVRSGVEQYREVALERRRRLVGVLAAVDPRSRRRRRVGVGRSRAVVARRRQVPLRVAAATSHRPGPAAGRSSTAEQSTGTIYGRKLRKPRRCYCTATLVRTGRHQTGYEQRLGKNDPILCRVLTQNRHSVASNLPVTRALDFRVCVSVTDMRPSTRARVFPAIPPSNTVSMSLER